jgi:hypothetical protein
MAKRARNMSEEASKEALDIFCCALDIASPGERAAFLNRACRGQAKLRASLDKLLASQPAAEKFFLEAKNACCKLLGSQ